MTVTTLRPPPAPAGFTGIYQTPPTAVREAALAFSHVFDDAPIAIPVAAVCKAFLDHAENDVEKALGKTLVAVGWADGIELYRAVEEIAGAYADLQQHEQTTGHDSCCGYNCETCVPGRPGASRCERCQAIPQERLDFAVSALLDIPAQRLTAHVHDELFTAAAGQ